MAYISRTFLVAGLLLVMTAAQANRLAYQSPIHEADWQTRLSRLQCSLWQDIPSYGRAEFVRAAGLQLGLRIHAEQGSPEQGQAELRIDPPAWRHDVEGQRVAMITRRRGETPFRLDQALSLRVLQGLEQGLMPTLSYREAVSGNNAINIALSSVRFHDALGEFRRCNAALITIDYRRASNTVLLFGSGTNALDDAARRRLRAVADYLQNDPAIKRVSIAGYTDNQGTRGENYRLSRERAQVVLDYLLSLKVPEDKVSFDYFGEHNPVADNRTAKGRASNRRVEVRLVK